MPDFYQHPPPGPPLPREIRDNLAELKSVLQRWLDVFEGFLISHEFDFHDSEDTAPKHITEIISQHALIIEYWVSYIWLYTCFCRVQTVHDTYLLAFTTITELAEKILKLQPGRQGYYNLAADTQVIQPLMYVALKCRDGSLRRRALDLLRKSGREGVWDGQCSAAACAWSE
jgi:hypothetical protein